MLPSTINYLHQKNSSSGKCFRESKHFSLHALEDDSNSSVQPGIDAPYLTALWMRCAISSSRLKLTRLVIPGQSLMGTASVIYNKLVKASYKLTGSSGRGDFGKALLVNMISHSCQDICIYIEHNKCNMISKLTIKKYLECIQYIVYQTGQLLIRVVWSTVWMLGDLNCHYSKPASNLVHRPFPTRITALSASFINISQFTCSVELPCDRVCVEINGHFTLLSHLAFGVARSVKPKRQSLRSGDV